MQVDCECDDEDNCTEIKCKVDKDKAPDSEDVYFYCKAQDGSVRMYPCSHDALGILRSI